MTSISRESFEPFTIVFLLISLLLIFLLAYYYKSLLKSYLIETDDSITIGNFNDEQTIKFKEIEKVVEDNDNYKVYYNDKKYRVSKKVFTPDKLTEYIKSNFGMDDKGLLKNTFLRDNNSNDRVTSYGKLDRNHKYYNLVHRINKDLDHVEKLSYQEKLDFLIEYIPRIMDDPEFNEYFSSLYSTTISELRVMKSSDAKYISYTRLIVDNNIDYNNLIETLMTLVYEYRSKIWKG